MDDDFHIEPFSGDLREFKSDIFSGFQLDLLIEIVLHYDEGGELIQYLESIAINLARSANKKDEPSVPPILRSSIKRMTAFKKALSNLSDFDLRLVGISENDRDEYIKNTSATFEEIRPLFSNIRREFIDNLKPIFDIYGVYDIPASTSADSDCMNIIAIIIDAAQFYAPEKDINFDPEAIVKDLFRSGIPRPMEKKAIIEKIINKWKTPPFKE